MPKLRAVLGLVGLGVDVVRWAWRTFGPEPVKPLPESDSQRQLAAARAAGRPRDPRPN